MYVYYSGRIGELVSATWESRLRIGTGYKAILLLGDLKNKQEAS